VWDFIYLELLERAAYMSYTDNDVFDLTRGTFVIPCECTATYTVYLSILYTHNTTCYLYTYIVYIMYTYASRSNNLLRRRILCTRAINRTRTSQKFSHLFDIPPTEHAVFGVPPMGWRVHGVLLQFRRVWFARSVIRRLRNSPPPAYQTYGTARTLRFESIRAPIL